MANANSQLYPARTGRPLKLSDPKQVQKAIDKYFKSCFGPKRGENNEILTDAKGNIEYQVVRPFTMAGLANALGIGRQTLLDYRAKDEFSDVLTRARRVVEQFAEERLFDREGVQGAKFSLINNFLRWSDKSEIVQTNTNLLDTTSAQPAQLTTGDTSAILSALKAIIVRLTPEAEPAKQLTEISAPVQNEPKTQ